MRPKYVKRLFDLSLTILGFVALVPVFLFVGYLVRVRINSPVFFKQMRPGLYGRPFTLYKFRTMTDERDEFGNLLPDSQRLCKLGRFLRSTSLDELPELINVFKGEMSIVGPRPLLMKYLDRYSPEQARRHQVKPGITGWAQVNGRNGITWEQKFKYDVWYVDHWALWLDVKIILRTLAKVIKREGISEKGQETMSEFLGSNANLNQGTLAPK